MPRSPGRKKRKLLCGAFHQSFVCELGGDGGMRKGHRPFTQRSRSREEVERGSVCVRERERERERERKGQHVGKRELMFREGICLGYYCNREWRWVVIDWDNWGGNKRCFVHFRIQVRGSSQSREGKCGLLCLCQLQKPHHSPWNERDDTTKRGAHQYA